MGGCKPASVQLTGKEFRTEESGTRLVVKAKPQLFDAVFLSGVHRMKDKVYTYGCVVELPNDIIYFTEEEFGEYFEIIEEVI